jgi:hypothetical protein
MATSAGRSTGDPTPAAPKREPVPWRAAAVVIGLALLMGSAFAFSYTVALGRPAPHDVPVAVVGTAAENARITAALQEGAEEGLDLRPYPSLASARSAVDEQDVFAIVDGGDTPPTLYVSGASGSSVSRLLTQVVQAVPPDIGVRVVDLHPLPESDPQGLTSFYVTIAATILGLVTVFQLRVHAGGVGLRVWLGYLTVLSAGAGIALTLVVDPLLGALQGPFWEFALVLALQTATTASFNSLMIVLVGRWAIIPTWGVFILLGNTSSGGAVAAPLLPAFFALAGRVLPTGATVAALHQAAYFRGHQHLEPYLVLALWFVVVGVAMVAVRRWRGKSPAQ